MKLSPMYMKINNTDVQTLKERILLVYFTLVKYFEDTMKIFSVSSMRSIEQINSLMEC